MKKHLFNTVQYLSHEPQWKETRSSRMADDPPYLTVGTEVSAKYKGAFCEAKIRKVVRTVKCKVTFKAGNGSALLTDDQIKGALRIGANVEAKHPDKSQFIEATINKIQDCSQYTVVFDDGDITTLRRSALCLKSGRHFNESETLDQLPLTHPEHFSNPVVGGRRGVRRRAADKDDSSEEEDEEIPAAKKDGKKKYEKELDMGKVVCVESTDKKKSKDTWFPALVVSPSAQETVKIRIKDEYLVRSFRDGRYYTVPKKEITEFTKDSRSKYDSTSNVLRSAVEKASLYLDKNELPPHWDREVLFGNARQSESGDGEDQQSESEVEDDPRNEEKDRFIAQLYKFMDDRSTPLNKVPQVCNKDLDLHKLFKIVTGKGGYTKVTNQGQWKSATIKLGYGNMPSTSTINLVKQAYKKFLFNFEEFYRKLGCTWTPRSSVTTSSKSRSSRSIFRERGTPAASSSRETVRDKKDGGDEEDGRATPSSSKESKGKDKPEKPSPEEKEKPALLPSPELDSPPTGDTGSEASDVKPKADPPEEIRKSARGRQPKKDRDAEESASPTPSSRKKRQATASRDRDRDSSVASSTKDDGSAPPTPSGKDKEPATATTPTKKGAGVGRGKYKRHSSKGAPEPEPEKEEEPPKEEEKPVVEPPPVAVALPTKSNIEIRLGDKLQVYYPKSEGKTYEAKVIDTGGKNGSFLVHYTGWNNRYDEWIDKARVSLNITMKMEQTGDDGSKSCGSSSGINQGGPGARAPGAKQRKGRNSTSTTSTTSASSGTTPTPPQPTTPSTTRSGASKAAAAAAASLSLSPVSGKRRRSTSSEVVQAIPAPKRRRTRQKSGQGTSAGQASDSEPESSDSDGKSMKSERSSDMADSRRTSRKDSVTPTPLTTDSKTTASKRGSLTATVEETKPASKSEKKKASSTMEIDDDEMSCSSITSTKSKDAGKTPVSASTAVDDSKESFSSSSSNSTSGQVIDLDQIRSEMKGLDKIMKGSPAQSVSAVSSPAPPTLSAAVGSSPSSEPSKMDIYEFQEDGNEDTAAVIAPTAPKLKMFSPVARPSPAAPEKTEKSTSIVSASSVEAVAKLGSTQDLPDKVPIVAIEKMEKDKEKDRQGNKAGSSIRDIPTSEPPSDPSNIKLSLITLPVTPTVLAQSAKEVVKVTPGKSLSTTPASTPITTPPAPTATTSAPLQVIVSPPAPTSVIIPGGSASPFTQTTMSSSVILSTGITSSVVKGKTALSVTPKATPVPTPLTATIMGTIPRIVSVMTAPSSSTPAITSHPPPPPLLIPSTAIVTTSPSMTTSSVVAATISPSISALSSITSPPPPLLLQQAPVRTATSQIPAGISQLSIGTPERPLLTPIVTASVSKVDPKLPLPSSTAQFRKQDLFPHLIQHSPADPSASASIPTISIISAKPSTAEIIAESSQPSSLVPPPQPVQQPLKIAATIPPPPPVVVKTPLRPGFGSGPVVVPNTDSPRPKKKKMKTGIPGLSGPITPAKTLAPLPTVGAPPPPPVVISSMSIAPTTTTTVTPTPGRKTPVKKRIPPPMDSPVKPIKPLGMGLAGPSGRPGKMNPEAMNAAIASVGATPAPTSIAVPTTVITPISTIFQTHHGSPGVLFATNTSSLANQPPPPPVNLLKSNLPAPIKSSSESIAASIAAVASMGGTTASPKTTTPPTTSSLGKLGMPMKRFMKDSPDKMQIKDKVFTISGGSIPSAMAHLSHVPPPPLVIGKTISSSSSEQTSSQHQPLHSQPPPITIQAKFQPVPHSIPGGLGIGSGSPVTLVKAPQGSTTPVQGTHHIYDSPHQHPHPHHQVHPKTNLPKHPVIIIPAAPVVIKPAPFQHQQQQPQHLQQPVIVPKPLQLEGQPAVTITQTPQQPSTSVLVTAASSGIVKPMLPITVTPSNFQQVTNVPSVSIHSLSNVTHSSLSFNRGNLPAVELKPVMSITSTSTADLPPSITVTRATTVMKSISPDIVAVSSYNSSMKNATSVFTAVKQEDRTSFGKEPEIVVKPAPASAQIIFHTEAKKAAMEPIQIRHQLPSHVVLQKSDVKEPDENSLLCEEIIPGSPTAGDVDDKMDDDVKDSKRDDLPSKTKIDNLTLSERGAATPPSSSGGTTPSVGGSGKPVIVLGPKYGEDILDDERIGFALEDRMSKYELDDDEDDNKMMEERSVDSPMGPPSEGREVDLQFRDSFSEGEGGDHSPPSSPSTGSSISSDDSERRHRTSRMSPTHEGGSSKSKDSDDDDMDSDGESKSTHLDDADSKHGSTRGSTRIRNQTSRLGRSPSPPTNKRRRTMRRNKSPEESRYVGRTIRTSSGRKVTPVGRHGDDSYIEKEKEVKQPPPAPFVNLTKPPKTGKYNFIPPLSKNFENITGIIDAEQRISLISQAINDLKEQYQKTKTEAASFDRRLKRRKRRAREKERLARQEATKAAS